MIMMVIMMSKTGAREWARMRGVVVTHNSSVTYFVVQYSMDQCFVVMDEWMNKWMNRMTNG